MNQKLKLKIASMRADGFSLLETLIALAIMSLTSLVLFQSTASMLSVSDKASDASNRIVESTIARATFKKVIGELTPGWPEREVTVFRGTTSGFSGLTASFPSVLEQQLTPISMEIQSRGQNRVDLILQELGEEQTLLESFTGAEGSFSYLGQDQLFYPIWPPERLQNPGFQQDASFREVPELPAGIRFTVLDTNNSDDIRVFWLATVNGLTRLPYRDEAVVEDNEL